VQLESVSSRTCVCVWLNLGATFGFLKDAVRFPCFKNINFAFEKARFFIYVIHLER
jgi:hypothetical protein